MRMHLCAQPLLVSQSVSQSVAVISELECRVASASPKSRIGLFQEARMLDAVSPAPPLGRNLG